MKLARSPQFETPETKPGERPRRLNRVLALGLGLGVQVLIGPRTLEAAEPEPRRVLIISSFGSRFAPFDTFASVLRTDIARQWPGSVEFLEAPLEMARFAQASEDAPFAEYIAALTAHRHVDLVVTIGGPAASFVGRHRASLFPSTNLLVTGLDDRVAREVPPAPGMVVVGIHLDPTAILEEMLRVLPGTTRVAVVLGDSPLERMWRVLLERELAPFGDRVAFTWLNTLSLDGMRRAVAALPPRSAVLYAGLYVDAAGVPQEEGEGLPALRRATRAPIFGVYETQIGKGIVGGPLLSVNAEARRSAAVAVRLLRGEPAGAIPIPPPEPLKDIYDWRELHRWGIDQKRLPVGAEVRYRAPSLWEAYGWQTAIGLAVLLAQALLIAALLAHRKRLRRAREHARGLNRRLITAHEEERRSIARELHDDLTQRLALLSIDAAELSQVLEPGASADVAAGIQKELSNLSGDVHVLAQQLHPTTLGDLGLTEALRIECDRVTALGELSARLYAPATETGIGGEAAMGLFRIAQEGLRNAVRHARARIVEVRLEVEDKGARLTIHDDGEGFDPDRALGRPGIGLVSMRERTELFGGRFEIRSAPGRGTTLDVWAPLEERS